MLTLSDYISWVRSWQIDALETIRGFQEKAEKNELNAWISCTWEYVEKNLDKALGGALCAAPIGIKDNIMTKWYRSTCGSKMLENYVPEYDATCFENLEKAGGLMIGKNNMDEFAMGSSGENSAFGATKNPHDHSRITWWTSSGWAASVANGECIAAIWTDTGWSVRQPAAFCGIVWFKPSYGNISRYGVQSMSNSLDQVWVMTHSVEDAWILYNAIRGFDSMDMNSLETQDQANMGNILESAQDLIKESKSRKPKICVFNDFFGEGIDSQIKDLTMNKINNLKSQWYQVDFLDFPLLSSLIASYYIICPAEVSTNMARFDGIRYGLQNDTSLFDSLSDYYTYIRTHWFGNEVKRRIVLGAHVLSSGYQDQYYNKAIAIKDQVKRDLLKIYEDYDIILWPTSPVWPREIWWHSNNPLADYLSDAYTIVANLIGAPAMSVPGWFWIVDGVSLPFGIHIMAKPGNDKSVFLMWSLLTQNGN